MSFPSIGVNILEMPTPRDGPVFLLEDTTQFGVCGRSDARARSILAPSTPCCSSFHEELS